MRGGAQALLVRDATGNAYVAKCVGNPQGTRTLINEWIVSRLLKYLRMSTPAVHPLRIERDLPGGELLEFQVGKEKIPIPPGIHLGSRCPVDPARKAIFDFLPRRLLNSVVNLPDVIAAFAFDKWVNQTDTRQAIFVRERSTGPSAKFRAYLIDHGLSFGGSRWEMWDGALNGLYFDRAVYDNPSTVTECHAAVDRIRELPERDLLSIEKEIPLEWLKAGDTEEMTRLLELLCTRRAKLHDTIDRALRQLDEAGIVIPKASERKQLLGALLLLACIPRSLSPTRMGRGIEFGAARTVEPWRAQRIGDAQLSTSFDFTVHSGIEEENKTYRVQIWKRQVTQTNSEDSTYFFRIYPQNKDGFKTDSSDKRESRQFAPTCLR